MSGRAPGVYRGGVTPSEPTGAQPRPPANTLDSPAGTRPGPAADTESAPTRSAPTQSAGTPPQSAAANGRAVPHEHPAGSDEVGHTHADVSGGWLRPAVFGAMDGLVTNISLVAGVSGAKADAHLVVLTGLAGLIAGAFSMALGEYTSVETQNNAVRAEAAVEQAELARNPHAEQAELVQMYRDMGLRQETAELVAAEIHADPELAVRVHLTQELGIDPEEQPSPWTAGISSFLCFALGAVLPLIPFLFGLNLLVAGLALGGVGLFVAGALVARFTTRTWWVNGVRQLIFGGIAASITYFIGSLIGVSAGG